MQVSGTGLHVIRVTDSDLGIDARSWTKANGLYESCVLMQNCATGQLKCVNRLVTDRLFGYIMFVTTITLNMCWNRAPSTRPNSNAEGHGGDLR